jgi:transcriptional regulator with XRE-family HTH domain
VTTKERSGDRGPRRGERLLSERVADGRDARVTSNLTQREVGSAIGVSDSRVSAMERGAYQSVPFVLVARYLSVVGLELSARAYPVGSGLRDEAQLKLLGRLRSLASPDFMWLTETPMPMRGDLRAWDAGLVRDALRIGIDAETRIRDA